MESNSIFAPTLESKYVNTGLWEKIQHIDLQLIIDRLQLKYHWSQKRIKKVIARYRQFLYIAAVCEDSLSPSKEVDLVWHNHILHTKKYAYDCKKTFGYFLHHLPTPQLMHVCDGGGGPDSKCQTCAIERPKGDEECDTQKSLFQAKTAECTDDCGSAIEKPDESECCVGGDQCFDHKPKIFLNKAFCGVEGDGDCRKHDCEGTAMMAKPKKVIAFDAIIPKFFILN
jgi:hypothetical protein